MTELEAQIFLIPALPEPRSYGLTEEPQAWLIRKQSRALFSYLHKAQDPWGPSGLLSARIQALYQMEYRLKHRVSQAIRKLKALQAMLALSSQGLSGDSSKGVQTLEGFLEKEGTALGLLLPELYSDLCCLESQLAGGIPCSSPRCEEVTTALWAGRLPPPWRRHMSAGPQPPWLWLHQLWCQGQLLTKYLSQGGFNQQNRSFHLSAFRYPKGLLLAIRWEASQNWASHYIANLKTTPKTSGYQRPTCPAPVPGARPQFQLRPSFISPTVDRITRTDSADLNSRDHPQLSLASRCQGGPCPSLGGGSIRNYRFYDLLGLHHDSNLDSRPWLPIGHSQRANFDFNLNAGTARQGIEAIGLRIQVECGPKPSAPEGGILITGLLLHHAEWNPEDKALQDGHSGKPSPLPPISVSPRLMTQEPLLPSSPLPMPLYLCPVYLGGALGTSRLDSARLLLYLPLSTKVSPDICAHRRVYVCSPPLT